jgi:large subunit ribosomal protein L3
MAFILGRKVKMSQLWKGEKVIPITIIKAEPNMVSLLRTKEKEGYEAVQVALGKIKREFKIKKGGGGFRVGEVVEVSVFKEGDLVKVSGVTKGRGFQGVVKRHGFGGGPKTHGQKNRFRAPGSIGSTAFQRVVPGRRMAGRMGNERVTIKNLEVAGVDKKNNLLMLKGAVPGARGTLLEISKS